MKSIEEKINDILANWNPINVPDELAHDEYKSHIPIIMKNGFDRNLLFYCMCNITTNIIGLGFDITNQNHIRDLNEVCNEIFNVINQK